MGEDKEFIDDMRHKLLSAAEYLERKCDVHLNERTHSHHHHEKKNNRKDPAVVTKKIATVFEVEKIKLMPGQETHSSYNQVAVYNLNQLIKQTLPRVPQKADGAHARPLADVLNWPFDVKKAHLIRYINDKDAHIIQINHKRPILDRQVALLERKLQAREVQEANEAHAKAFMKMLVAEADAAADAADSKARAAGGEGDSEEEEEENAEGTSKFGRRVSGFGKFDMGAERRETLREKSRKEKKKQREQKEQDALRRARERRAKVKVVKPRRDRNFIIELLPVEKSVKRVLLALKEEAARQGRCWKPVKVLAANQNVKLRMKGEELDPAELAADGLDHSGADAAKDVVIRGKTNYGGGMAGFGKGDQMLSWIRDAAGDGKSEQKGTGSKSLMKAGAAAAGRRNSVSTMAALDGTTMAARIMRCTLDRAGYYACVHRGVQMAERVRLVAFCSTSPTPKKGATVKVSVWLYADRYEQEDKVLRKEMGHRKASYWSMVNQAGVRDLRLRRFAQLSLRVNKENVHELDPPKPQPEAHIRKQAQGLQLLGYADSRFHGGWREDTTVAEKTKTRLEEAKAAEDEAAAKAKYNAKKALEEKAAALPPSKCGLDTHTMAEAKRLEKAINEESKADVEAGNVAVVVSRTDADKKAAEEKAAEEKAKAEKPLSKEEEKQKIITRIKSKRFSIMSGAALGGAGSSAGYGITLKQKEAQEEERLRKHQEEQQHDEGEAQGYTAEEDMLSNQSEDDDFEDSYEAYLREEEAKEAKVKKKKKEEQEEKEEQEKQDSKAKAEKEKKAKEEAYGKAKARQAKEEQEQEDRRKNWHKTKKSAHELDDSDYELTTAAWCGTPVQLFSYELHVPMRMQAEVYQDRSLQFRLSTANGPSEWQVLPVEVVTGAT
jgi:hypothetical protein